MASVRAGVCVCVRVCVCVCIYYARKRLATRMRLRRLFPLQSVPRALASAGRLGQQLREEVAQRPQGCLREPPQRQATTSLRGAVRLQNARLLPASVGHDSHASSRGSGAQPLRPPPPPRAPRQDIREQAGLHGNIGDGDQKLLDEIRFQEAKRLKRTADASRVGLLLDDEDTTDIKDAAKLLDAADEKHAKERAAVARRKVSIFGAPSAQALMAGQRIFFDPKLPQNKAQEADRAMRERGLVYGLLALGGRFRDFAQLRARRQRRNRIRKQQDVRCFAGRGRWPPASEQTNFGIAALQQHHLSNRASRMQRFAIPASQQRSVRSTGRWPTSLSWLTGGSRASAIRGTRVCAVAGWRPGSWSFATKAPALCTRRPSRLSATCGSSLRSCKRTRSSPASCTSSLGCPGASGG